MFFSLITLKEGHERDAAHELAGGPYVEHQWLWNFFPAPEGTRRDFLFRRSDVGASPRFYVVSKRPPLARTSAWEIQTREYAPELKAGDRLHFDLRANPVVTRTLDGKHGRHDVVMQEKKRLLQERGLARWQDWQDDDKPALYTLVRKAGDAWLRSRASRLGFEVDEDNLAVDGYQRHSEKDGRIRFSTVDFSGELTVADAAMFATALHDGVGPAKSFGCGLLLVRRI